MPQVAAYEHITENLQCGVFVQAVNASWFSVQKKGCFSGVTVGLVVGGEKHLFSDSPGNVQLGPETRPGRLSGKASIGFRWTQKATSENVALGCNLTGRLLPIRTRSAKACNAPVCKFFID